MTLATVVCAPAMVVRGIGTLGQRDRVTHGRWPEGGFSAGGFVPRMLIALCVVGAFVLTAAPGAASDAPTVGVDTVVKVKAAGISLRYPSSWLAVADSREGAAADAQVLAATDPKLADIYNTAAARVLQDPASALYAADMQGVRLGAFPSAVGVRTIGYGGYPSSLREFKANVVPGVEKTGATVLRTTAVKLAGKTAYRLDATALAGGRPARLSQLSLARGAVPCPSVSSPQTTTAGQALIDDVLNSVRITERSRSRP